MTQNFGGYRLRATWIFDPEDSFARLLGTRGRHPRPIEPLRFWLIDEQPDGGSQPLPLPLEMVTVANASGYHTFFDEFKVPDGGIRRHSLANGTYTVRITSPYYQPATRADITLPANNPLAPVKPTDAPYHYNLQPGPAYPFAGSDPLRAVDLPSPCSGRSGVEGSGPTLLRGSFFTLGGQPVTGASVQTTLGGAPFEAETDRKGSWILALPPELPTGPADIVITPLTGAPVTLTNVCIVRGREITIANTSLRGLVTQNGVPAANVVVQIDGMPGQVTTNATGAWAYYFPLDKVAPAQAVVTATLPSGESLSAPQIDVSAGRTTDVPPLRF